LYSLSCLKNIAVVCVVCCEDTTHGESKILTLSPKTIMKIDIKDFEYNGEKKFKIKNSDTKVKDFYESAEEYELMKAEIKEVIDKRQSLMYADNRYAMLMIFKLRMRRGKMERCELYFLALIQQGFQYIVLKDQLKRN